MCKSFSKGMPEWQPRSLWKCCGFRLSIYLLLQIALLAYFLIIVVKSDDQQERGKGFHKLDFPLSKQIDIPLPPASSGVNSSQTVQVQAAGHKKYKDCNHINICQNTDNCSEQINKCLSFDEHLNNIAIQICYPSAFALPLSTSKMHQQQRRFGRRFQLYQKRQSAFCRDIFPKKKHQSTREKAVWLDFELIDDSTGTILDGSMFFGKQKYSAFAANRDFEIFRKILFSWNSYSKSQIDSAEIVPIVADFLDNISDGAFIDDFVLVALAMDLSGSMDFWRKSGENFSIYWKVERTEKIGLNEEERQKRLKECAEEVEEMNRKAGVRMYEVKEAWCFMTYRERSQLFGELPDPNPEGLNQTFGGQAKKPLVPVPPEDPKKQRARMNCSTVPAEYAFNPNKRTKRQTASTELSGLKCDMWVRDARHMWSGCEEIISHIRRQKSPDCWSVAAASVLTDRACIAAMKAKNASGKLSQFKLGQNYLERVVSARDTTECTYGKSKGHGGGDTHMAWQYYTRKGTVNELCKPYIDKNPKPGWETQCFHSCDSIVDDNGSLDLLHWRDKTNDGKPFPGDTKNYADEETPEQWASTKGYAGTLYKAIEYRKLYRHKEPGWEQTIINEFEENGPFCASMISYDDFLKANGKAIYRHNMSYFDPVWHSIRIIGYGEYDCTGIGGGIDKFWLAANSWGTQIQNEGTILIARGENECGIEDDIVFGQVKWVFGD